MYCWFFIILLISSVASKYIAAIGGGARMKSKYSDLSCGDDKDVCCDWMAFLF